MIDVITHTHKSPTVGTQLKCKICHKRSSGSIANHSIYIASLSNEPNKIRCLFYPISYLDQAPKTVDGIIVMGNFSPENQQLIKDFFHKDTPMVFIGRCCAFPEIMDWITYDVEQCVRLAAEQLLLAGRKRLLYIGGINLQGPDEHKHKIAYFQTFLKEHPEVECLDILEGEHGSDSGYQMMSNWLAQNPHRRPDGIFISNDPIAFGALRALAEDEITVPDDVSVVVINGDAPGSNTIPPLTTIDVHTEEMGTAAVNCLLEQICKKRKFTTKLQYCPTLVIRKSV